MSKVFIVIARVAAGLLIVGIVALLIWYLHALNQCTASFDEALKEVGKPDESTKDSENGAVRYTIVSEDSYSVVYETDDGYISEYNKYDFLMKTAKEKPNITKLTVITMKDNDRFGNDVRTPYKKLVYSTRELTTLRQYTSVSAYMIDEQKDKVDPEVYMYEDGKWVDAFDSKLWKEYGDEVMRKLNK